MSVVRGIFSILVSAVVCLTASTHAFAAATNQSLAIPGYSYPTSSPDAYWDPIVTAGGTTIPFVIVNASNGPGANVDTNYAALVSRTASAGIKNFGYVHTSYQTRPIASVLAEIDQWKSLYGNGINGIFFDEIDATTLSKRCYLATLHNYIKTRYPSWRTVMNPGVRIPDSASPYADIFVTAEADYLTYATLAAPTSVFETTASNQNRIMHIVHSTPTVNYSNVITKSVNENAGWVYITNDIMPNPYDALPSNFSSLQSSVTALPASTLPNMPVAAMPASCIDISATTTPVTNNTTDITVKNTTTSTVPTSLATTVRFSLPQNVQLASASGTEWTCNGNDCTTSSSASPNSIVASVLTARFTATCNTSPSPASYTILDSANTQYTSGQINISSSACPPTNSPSNNTPASQSTNTSRSTTLASTGESTRSLIAIGGSLSVVGLLALLYRRRP